MTRKITFFEGWSWFKFNNSSLALVMALKFYISVEKGSKLKVGRFCGLILTFVELQGKNWKVGGGGGVKWITDEQIIFDTVFLILKNQSIWIQDSFKVISLFKVRSFTLEKDIKRLKRREKFPAENFYNFAM